MDQGARSNGPRLVSIWHWLERTPLDHVPPDGRAGVANSELDLQLQGDAILFVLRVIRGYPLDEVDVFTRNCRSA